MTANPVLVDIDARGVATVTLNRPHRNNAYNYDMIQELLEGVDQLADDPSVNVIVVRGNGDYFQAGADLKYMNELSTKSADVNLEMSTILTDAVRHLNACPKPTIALVHGGCFGGGLGVMAACDITIASEEAIFSITEVRWGLVAGPILPQLVDAMGLHAVRRYALTAERFTATQARDFGMVHEICATGQLDQTAAPVIEALLKCSPSAITETKALILDMAAHQISDDEVSDVAGEHAARRQTRDAIEGMRSFNEKRQASWYPEN